MDPATGTIASRALPAGAEAARPPEPVETTAADKVAYTFYGVAATAALVGQVWAGVKHIPWPTGFHVALQIALVTPAVGVIELGGVATSALADVRRRKGENAYAYRAMSLAAALVALAFNVVGHWSPGERFLAFGFGGLSAFAYVLWIIHSGARRRDALRATGHMAQTAPVYGIVRWLREPRVTYRARQLALEHGYGLYESIRIAEQKIRTEDRNKSIAGVVVETIKEQHKDRPLHAKIAETAYDPDAIAAEIRGVVDDNQMAHHIARVIAVPDVDDVEDSSTPVGESPAAAVPGPDNLAADASAEAGAELLQELVDMLRVFKAERGTTATSDTAAESTLSGQASGQAEPRPDSTDDPEPPDEPGPDTPTPPGRDRSSDGSTEQAHRHDRPVPAGQPELASARDGGYQNPRPPAGPLGPGDQGLADNESPSDTVAIAPHPAATVPPPDQAMPQPAAAPPLTGTDSGGQPKPHASTRSGKSDYWTRAEPALDAWAASGEEVTPKRLTEELGIPARSARRMVEKWEELQEENRPNDGDNVYSLTGQR
ncbi:MAG TPA: hypothetical protein VGL36_35650 [Kribbella sp.]